MQNFHPVFLKSLVLENKESVFRSLSPDEQKSFIKSLIKYMPEQGINSVRNYCKKLNEKAKAIENDQSTTEKGINPCIPAVNQNFVNFITVSRFPPPPNYAWFSKIDFKNFLAIDVEGIFPYNRRLSLPASVCAVDFDENVVFERLIYHKPGTFNPLTWLTGFKKDSLKNGQSMPKVLLELRRLVKGKTLIFCGHQNDLRMLALKESRDCFELFDLHWHYHYKDEISGYTIPHNLKTLAKNVLNKEIQKGVHTAFEDALNTMKIFKQYMIEINENPIFNSTKHEKCNKIYEYGEFEIVKNRQKQKN